MDHPVLVTGLEVCEGGGGVGVGLGGEKGGFVGDVGCGALR